MDFQATILNPTVIFFAANTLYVISYTLANIIWLRVLAIIASLLTMPYFFAQAPPLWGALFWQAAYFLVNFVNLIILFYDRRAPKFSETEKRIAERVFSDLEPHEVMPLLKQAQQISYPHGEHLLNRGDHNSKLMLVVEGRCVAYKFGKLIAEIAEHELVGEMSFITGDEVSADVIAEAPLLVYVWDKPALEKLYAKQSLYKAYIHSLCGVDLARKLRLMTEEQHT